MNRDLSKETYFKQFTALEPCFRQCYTTNVWKEVFVCIKCVKRGLCVHEKRPVQETNERDGFKTHQYRGASLESAICVVATNVSKEADTHEKRPTNMERGLRIWKETCQGELRKKYIKKTQYLGVVLESAICVATNVSKHQMCQSNKCVKRGRYTWKEANKHGKRPTNMKRDVSRRTEMCQSNKCVKRGLRTWKEADKYEKRPMYMERDLSRRITEETY